MNLKRAGTKRESPKGAVFRFPLLMKTIMSLPNIKPYIQWNPINNGLMGVVLSEDVVIQISRGLRGTEVIMGFLADHSMRRLHGWDDFLYDKTPAHIETNQEVLCGKDKDFRWKGPVVNGKPFGYGSLFDNDNILHYRGFFYGEFRVCYGVMCCKDGKTPCYCGGYWNGKEMGYGTRFNRAGSVIQETYIILKEDSMRFNPVHSLLTVLMIPLMVVKIKEDKSNEGLREFMNSSCDFIIGSWMPNLKHLLIDMRMMSRSTRFELIGLPSLESMVVGDFSFTFRNEEKDPPEKKGGSFIVADCPNLQVMGFGKFAFADYTSIKLYRLPSLSRIGFGQSTFEYCSDLELKRISWVG